MTDSDVIDVVEISGFRLDRGSRRLTDPDGAPVQLASKPFDTLLYLVANPGRVVDKQDLLDAVWPGVAVEENTLNHSISAVRRALGDCRTEPRFIATIQGRGYQFVAPVRLAKDHRVEGHPRSAAASTGDRHRARRGLLLGAAACVPAAVLIKLSGFGPGRFFGSSGVSYQAGEVHWLTRASTLELDPAISADGRYLAYAAGAIGQTDIFVSAIGGEAPVNLTAGLPGSHSWPRWSPDGTRIAFLTKLPRAPDAIRIVPAEGGDAVEVVRAPDLTGHDWSPDGHDIAYARVGDESGLYRKAIASAGDGERLAFADEPHSPAWSPDGARIAFVSENYPYAFTAESFANIATSAVVVVGADGGEAKPVTDMASLNACPAWASDSRSLFIVSDAAGTRDIFQVPVSEAGSARQRPRRLMGGLHAHGLSVSRDGNRLVYSEFISSANIWRLPIPRKGPVTPEAAEQITHDNQTIETLDVSSDGRWLVFDSDRSGSQSIFRLDLGSRELRQLTDHPGADFAPKFSSDGQQISFHALRSGNRDVFTMLADGSREQQVTSGPEDDRHPVFSPDGDRIAFWSDASGDQEIYVISRREDGESWTEPRRITFDGAWFPKWSPDGSRMAYTTRTRGHNAALVILSADDYRVQRNFDLPGDIRPIYPVWSRDNQAVYAKVHSADGTSAIWSFPVAGGEPFELINFSKLSPSGWDRMGFAVDENHLYFLLSERASDIKMLELNEVPG